MLRLYWLLFPVALVACASSLPPIEDGTPSDDFGVVPRARVHGRVVDSNGDGLGGVIVEALVFDDGWGFGEVTHKITSEPDGTWSWKAPAYTQLVLWFQHPDFAIAQRGFYWLRPESTHDVGTVDLRCESPVRFRIVSPDGEDLTRFARQLPDPAGVPFVADDEGWYSVCDSGWFRVDFLGDEIHFDELPDSPIEITTAPLHSILRVEYPDGSRVSNATLGDRDDSRATDGSGEIPLVGEYTSGTVVTVFKGDYSVEVELGQPGNGVTKCMMPRGGDIDFELICEQPVFPPGAFVVERLVDGEDDDSAGVFLGCLRGIVENVAPGEHTYHVDLALSYCFEDPQSQLVTVQPNVTTYHPIRLIALPTPEVRVRVVAEGGTPVSGAHVDHLFSRKTTEFDGTTSIRTIDFGEGKKQAWVKAQHSTLGYGEGSCEVGREIPTDIVLTPWSSLVFRTTRPPGLPIDQIELAVRAKSDTVIIHPRHFEDSPPWDVLSWEGKGQIERPRLRQGSYHVAAEYRGWRKTDVIELGAGSTEELIWELPELQPVLVRVLKGKRPARGCIRLVSPEPDDWSSAGWSRLDGDGRATLYPPAREPAPTITVRWDDKDDSTRRTWTLAAEDRVTLEVD